MSSKRQRKAKQKLPEVPQHPLHLRGEALEKRFEKRGVKDPTTSTVLRGMRKTQQMTERIEKARKSILQDRTLNEHAKKVEFAKYADSQGDKVFNTINQTQKAIDKRVDELSEKMNGPILEEGNTRQAPEIRDHVRSLEDKGARMKFIKQRIDAGDWETCSACLGTKHFLAGLDKDTRDNLKDHYKKKRFAKEFKTIEAFEKLNKQLLQRVRTLKDYEDGLKTDSVLRDIESQEERKRAMK